MKVLKLEYENNLWGLHILKDYMGWLRCAVLNDPAF
jgi:hypothetical protein